MGGDAERDRDLGGDGVGGSDRSRGGLLGIDPMELRGKEGVLGNCEAKGDELISIKDSALLSSPLSSPLSSLLVPGKD